MTDSDNGEIGGMAWEELCQKILPLKFHDEGYHEVPARFGGDLGIEGFTAKSGIAFQCYAPVHKLEAKELLKQQKIKINRDCNKLIDPKNLDAYKEILGGTRIKEWHFVTRNIEDKALLKERLKNIEKIRASKCPHIDCENFTIYFKTKKHFAYEIGRLSNVGEALISPTIPEVSDLNIRQWTVTNNTQHKRMEEKLKKIISEPTTRVDVMVLNVTKQIIGDSIMDDLRKDYPNQWLRIREIKATMEKDVAERSKVEHLTGNHLNEIRGDMLKRLEKEFGNGISSNALLALSQYTVASWLIDCPLDFPKS